MREPTVAWRLLWQAPYCDVRHVAPHVKLMSDLIVGRWWRDGTRVPDGPDDFDAEVPKTDFDRSPRCYSWDIALSFAPLFSTYGSAVNTLPYAAIGALRAVIRGRRATPLPPPPFDAGAGALWLSLTHNPDLSPNPNADSKAPPPIGVADKAGAVLLQRKRGILGGEGRSLLNEAAKLAPHSAGSTPSIPSLCTASHTPSQQASTCVPQADAFRWHSQPPRTAIIAAAFRLVLAQSEICTLYKTDAHCAWHRRQCWARYAPPDSPQCACWCRMRCH